MTDDTPQYTAFRAERRPYVQPPAPPPSEYWQRFRERVAQWREKNAEQYVAFEIEARRQLELPVEGELKQARQWVVDAVVAERVRALKGWPDQATWEASQ